MNMLSDGADWLRQQLHDHAGVDIRYYVSDASIGLTATVKEPSFVLERQPGINLHTEQRDYLIDPAELHFGGDTFEPSADDIITECVAGKTLTCKVLDIPGEGPFRYQEGSRRLMRVFTYVVETENA